jgi:hypothetical protein
MRTGSEQDVQPMSTSEYKARIRLQEGILYATGTGYELRKAIKQSRRNIEKSRRLINETKIILDESRLIMLASQRLTFKG